MIEEEGWPSGLRHDLISDCLLLEWGQISAKGLKESSSTIRF